MFKTYILEKYLLYMFIVEVLIFLQKYQTVFQCSTY